MTQPSAAVAGAVVDSEDIEILDGDVAGPDPDDVAPRIHRLDRHVLARRLPERHAGNIQFHDLAVVRRSAAVVRRDDVTGECGVHRRRQGRIGLARPHVALDRLRRGGEQVKAGEKRERNGTA
jgi:hypothetical protein